MPDQAVPDRVDEDENRRLWREMKARLVERLALPDTSGAEFQAEARRQAALLRGAPEEAEALDFIEAMMDTDDWDWDAVTGDE